MANPLWKQQLYRLLLIRKSYEDTIENMEKDVREIEERIVDIDQQVSAIEDEHFTDKKFHEYMSKVRNKVEKGEEE